MDGGPWWATVHGVILFPFVILPACDWLVQQHVHAVGEDVSVVSHIALSDW